MKNFIGNLLVKACVITTIIVITSTIAGIFQETQVEAETNPISPQSEIRTEVQQGMEYNTKRTTIVDRERNLIIYIYTMDKIPVYVDTEELNRIIKMEK